MTGHQPRQELLEVLSGPLADRGFDLEDVELSQAGRRSLVRVLIDTDGGVTLDAIADATHLVSDVLDNHDPLGDKSYTLEVTSPGTDRPLTAERHWRRNVGRLVKVTLTSGEAFTGRVTSAEDAQATLDVGGASRVVALTHVSTAHVEIEFNRHSSAAKE